MAIRRPLPVGADMIAFATLAEARRGSICAVVLAFGAMVALVLCRGVPRLLSLGLCCALVWSCWSTTSFSFVGFWRQQKRSCHLQCLKDFMLWWPFLLALASLRSSSRCREITDLQELHCKCTCLRVLDYQD